MQVIIRLPGGKHLPIDMNKTSTVDDLKSKIFEVEGIPSDVQRLVFSTQDLENTETFEKISDSPKVQSGNQASSSKTSPFKSM